MEKLKILFIKDESMDDSLEEAYKHSIEAVNDLMGIEYDERTQDLSEAVWWDYGEWKYFSTQWIKDNVVWETYKYDCVCYCVDVDNWKPNSGIHGVAYGLPIGNSFIQQVKIRENETYTKNTMLMEVAHAIDNIVLDTLGINLDEKLGLDFDEDLIHAEKEGEKLFDYEDDVKLVREYLDKALRLRHQHWIVYRILRAFNLLKHFPVYVNKMKDRVEKVDNHNH